MKKSILILSGILALSACSTDPLDLAPKSEIGANGFYTNDAEVELATIAIYDGMQAIPKIEFALSEMRSDNGKTKTSEGEWAEFESFTIQATNQQVQLYWAANYNVIFRANTVLANLDVVVDDALKMQLEGEAKFARALCHFKLANAYGDVPVIDRVVGPQDSTYFERKPVSTVMAVVIADLEDAIQLLPSKSGMVFGRATRGAATAILAKAHLREGNYSTSESLLADLLSDTDYALEDVYNDVFYDEGNDEILFAIPYVDDDLFESQDFSFEFTVGGVRSGLNYLTDDLKSVMDPMDTARTPVIANPLNTNECGKFLTASANARMCGNDWIVSRLADVYLMHVEAKMAGQGATQNLDAIASFNAVRARVGMAQVATDGTGEITLEELLAERRIELAFENHRFDDLTRTGQAQTVLSAFATAEGNIFTGTDLLLPIPQNEINVSEGKLSQNPGYN
ncbi:MAG: RagB/SusD family nutrient uptake outer membrane protein [Schleiferiaceae bacterium]|nr:RagB/SusD family nutrient uptake outer membrane protein [Schleiferiaceae bacterium]